MIKGISHITFIVKDLEKSTNFLTQIFDAKEVYSSGNKTFSISKEKFFLINKTWIAIMEGDSLYFYDYDNHLFEIHTGTLEKRLYKYKSKQPNRL